MTAPVDARLGQGPRSALAASAHQQRVVADLGVSALARISTDEIPLVEEAVRSMGETLDTTYVRFMQVAPDGATCVMRAAYGWPARLVGHLSAELDDASHARFTLRSRVPVVIDDWSSETRFEPDAWLMEHGVVSGISVLVGPADTPYGMLGAYSTSLRHFSPADVDFVQAMANVLGEALRRIRNDRLLAVAVERLQVVAAERQELILELVHAGERERARLAAEIHDDAVQVMAAVGMRLHTFRRTHGMESESLDRLEESVSLATGRLRRLLFQMRLPALDSEGLAAGIRTYLEQLKGETSVTYSLSDAVAVTPAVEVRMVIYRILQEALANVRKHSRASHVSVKVATDRDGVAVTVDDDGLGIPAAAERAHPGAGRHLGITMMEERAAEAGGWCTIERRDRGGTHVAFWVPTSPTALT